MQGNLEDAMDASPTEIDTWTILNDKLYFNYNQKVKEMWVKDQAGFIQKADKQWPGLMEFTRMFLGPSSLARNLNLIGAANYIQSITPCF